MNNSGMALLLAIGFKVFNFFLDHNSIVRWKMFRKISLSVFLILTCVAASSAFAADIEHSTSYPSPNGEYSDIKATGSFTIPVKEVNGDKTKVTKGEIWFEKCPAGKVWNGNACV